MHPPLEQRLKALFSEYDSPLSDYRFVMLNNAGSALIMAIAICAAVWWGTHLVAGTFICVAALTLLFFALLTICLLFRYAFWIPAVLVAVVNGACGGGLLWSAADHFCPLVRWPGAVVGFVVFFVSIFRTYAKVSTIAQKATMPS